MTTVFNRTRTQLAQRVLGQVIKIGAATAASAEYDTVYEAIDLRLKELHKNGIIWRNVVNVPVTFSVGAGIRSASAGAGDILFPLKVTFTNGSADDPVDIISPIQYAEIEDKGEAGNPQKAMWDRSTKFTLWPVPTANGTMKLLYERIADDTSAGAVIDLDVALLRNLITIIKYDVADDFGIDEQTQVRWERASDKAERNIRALNAMRVTFAPVAVDNFDDRQHPKESDYGR